MFTLILIVVIKWHFSTRKFMRWGTEYVTDSISNYKRLLEISPD